MFQSHPLTSRICSKGIEKMSDVMRAGPRQRVLALHTPSRLPPFHRGAFLCSMVSFQG